MQLTFARWQMTSSGANAAPGLVARLVSRLPADIFFESGQGKTECTARCLLDNALFDEALFVDRDMT